MKKILIFVSIAVIIIVSYLFYKSKNSLDNFTAVQKNLNTTLVNGIAVLNVQGRKLQFYSNGRFFIFNSSNQVLLKGNYYNGGLEVTADNGKKANTSDILFNFLSLV